MLFNTNKDARLNEGSCYYSKRHGRASVRKILRIKDEIVHFQRLYGPGSQMKLGLYGSCKMRTFRRWMVGEVNEHADFSLLNGAEIQPTFLVENVEGCPIFRCGEKRANFYVRKGFAEWIDEDRIRLTEAGRATEENLRTMYGGELTSNPFFMAEKNNQCVCCGNRAALTRHHIVPKRHKSRLPREVSRCLSNVLFVCADCHAKYERFSETEPTDSITDPVEIVHAWRNHFVDTMKPRFIPPGWNIFTMKPRKQETT